jgi:hypothetical protein
MHLAHHATFVASLSLFPCSTSVLASVPCQLKCWRLLHRCTVQMVSTCMHLLIPLLHSFPQQLLYLFAIVTHVFVAYTPRSPQALLAQASCEPELNEDFDHMHAGHYVAPSQLEAGFVARCWAHPRRCRRGLFSTSCLRALSLRLLEEGAARTPVRLCATWSFLPATLWSRFWCCARTWPVGTSAYQPCRY